MRIGLVYDCVYPFTLGGVEHRNAEIARALDDPVTIYGFNYWQCDPARMIRNVRYVSLGAARNLHAGGKRKIADSLATTVGTLRALLSSKDDVWDIANIAILPVIAAWCAAALKRRSLVVTWHEYFGDTWNDYLGPRLGPIARRFEQLALACSPLVIAVSPQTRDRLLAAGYSADRMRYIPNGINVRAIEAVAPGVGSDLVYAGRLASHKRVDLALRALAELRKTKPVTLAIIGDGPERSSLEGLSRELKLEHAVTFHGFLPKDDDVISIMKASRLAILPSAREGFGLAAVQAWACGLPVIVCDDADNATAGLVTDPRLGTVVPARVEPIAEACAKWLNEPGGSAFRIEHAREHYSLERMISAVRAVYEEAFRSR